MDRVRRSTQERERSEPLKWFPGGETRLRAEAALWLSDFISDKKNFDGEKEWLSEPEFFDYYYGGPRPP